MDNMRNSIETLKMMLDLAEIPYEECSDTYIRRIAYPYIGDDRVCSAVCGRGTYGNEKNKIEIMGLLTPEEEERDSVTGYLEPAEVFCRIYTHYKDHKEDL